MKIYNTMSNEVEKFTTIDPNFVRFYACGPTVYDEAHLGHARAAIAADTIRRYLEYKGYHVLFVQNFTDIDDKIINRANELGISTTELSEKYIQTYLEDMARLNVRRASIHPRATETLSFMIEMIQGLVDKGYAYVLESGEVLFDTDSFEDYGNLAKLQKSEEEDDAEESTYTRVDTSGKRNRRDFTLWKPQKEGEPGWDSPWGMGRPGWHIECSAMSQKFLGDQIDIHAGGQDLIFPHHTNEIAQSEAYTGKAPFCRYWVHNGFVQVDQEKMSKSLGNFFTIKEILEKFSGEVIRLFLLSTQYRKPIDFSDKSLQQAQRNYDRLQLALSLLVQWLRKAPEEGTREWEVTFSGIIKTTREEFEEAMDYDFNVPKALATIYTFAKFLITNLVPENEGITKTMVENAMEFYLTSLHTLGLLESIRAGSQQGGDYFALFENFSKVIQLLIDMRDEARMKKDYTTADNIRKNLRSCGVELDDHKNVTTWRYTA